MNENEDKLNKFIQLLTDTLEAHANSISELYNNQKRMAEGFQKLSNMNDKLIQALLRDESVKVN